MGIYISKLSEIESMVKTMTEEGEEEAIVIVFSKTEMNRWAMESKEELAQIDHELAEKTKHLGNLCRNTLIIGGALFIGFYILEDNYWSYVGAQESFETSEKAIKEYQKYAKRLRDSHDLYIHGDNYWSEKVIKEYQKYAKRLRDIHELDEWKKRRNAAADYMKKHPWIGKLVQKFPPKPVLYF